MRNTFIAACRGREVDRTPVWFMRQAGRYLPSYRNLRSEKGILEVAKNPELASDVTVDPVKQLGVDAAVLFADIMLPLEGVGIDFEIRESVGPIVKNPIRTKADVEALGEFVPDEHVGYVLETARLAVEKLGGTPLIGFSGAPFTLASYLIEGAPSREFQKTKAMMYNEPDTWAELMARLTKLVATYLQAQVRNGVSAVQLFDSWVGCLAPDDYECYVKEYTKKIFGAVRGNVPTIHFCADSSSLVENFASTGCDVISVDWRVPIDTVWARTGNSKAVQGNLDPAAAVAGGEVMARAVKQVMSRASGRRGHIFNLGHGVLKDTPPDNLKRIVAMVHGEKVGD